MKLLKSINRIARVITTFAVLLLFTSCAQEVTPTDPSAAIEMEQAAVLSKLSTTWNSVSFTRDGVDASSEFANLILTVGNQTYATQNGLHVWPSSGSWEFVDGKVYQIVRDNEVIIDLAVEDTSLTLSFEFDENIFTT